MAATSQSRTLGRASAPTQIQVSVEHSAASALSNRLLGPVRVSVQEALAGDFDRLMSISSSNIEAAPGERCVPGFLLPANPSHARLSVRVRETQTRFRPERFAS